MVLGERGHATVHGGLLAMGSLLAAFVLCGCQAPDPIEPQLYSRTPADLETRRLLENPAFVGVTAESDDQGTAFISHASNHGGDGRVAWVRPEYLADLDCQVSVAVHFENDRDGDVRYCLGRLIANVYDGDRSEFLGRIVRFQELMYTPKPGEEWILHDGRDSRDVVRAALFEDLLAALGRSVPETAPALAGD